MNPYRHPSFQGRFGVARRDITPPIGIYARNWGLAEHDAAEAIHQPLTLTALVLTDMTGGSPLAIVAVDLGWWRSSASEEALARAVKDAGFDPAQTLIALSHTHAAPSFCPHEADKPGGELIPGYLEAIQQQLTDALQEAQANCVEGILEVITGTSPLATVRELKVEGRPVVGWNPDADADQTLLLGRITARSGRPLATLVNYACHPTILAWQNRAISPDFVGTMREIVETETEAPCLFLQGASGELAARHQYTGDPGVAEKAGKVLAHSVLSLWHLMLPAGEELAFNGIAESGAPLGLWEPRNRTAPVNQRLRLSPSTIALPISPALPSLEELTAEERMTTDRSLLERLHRLRLRREAVGDSTETPRPCLVAALGDLRLVAIADEAYSSLQSSLRQTSSARLRPDFLHATARRGEPTPSLSQTERPLFVLTLVNRNLGYLVPEQLHSSEHYASRVSPFAPGSFERIRQHLEEQLAALDHCP